MKVFLNTVWPINFQSNLSVELKKVGSSDVSKAKETIHELFSIFGKGKFKKKVGQLTFKIWHQGELF